MINCRGIKRFSSDHEYDRLVDTMMLCLVLKYGIGPRVFCTVTNCSARIVVFPLHSLDWSPIEEEYPTLGKVIRVMIVLGDRLVNVSKPSLLRENDKIEVEFENKLE